MTKLNPFNDYVLLQIHGMSKLNDGSRGPQTAHLVDDMLMSPEKEASSSFCEHGV